MHFLDKAVLALLYGAIAIKSLRVRVRGTSEAARSNSLNLTPRRKRAAQASLNLSRALKFPRLDEPNADRVLAGDELQALLSSDFYDARSDVFYDAESDEEGAMTIAALGSSPEVKHAVEEHCRNGGCEDASTVPEVTTNQEPIIPAHEIPVPSSPIQSPRASENETNSEADATNASISSRPLFNFFNVNRWSGGVFQNWKPYRKVLVVGCGLAGALTALELAQRNADVHVIERGPHCGHGTSGRIAGELVFHYFNKQPLGWPHGASMMFDAWRNSKVKFSFRGVRNAVLYAASSSARGPTQRVTLSCLDFSVECSSLVFDNGKLGPMLTGPIMPGVEVEAGAQLERVVSKGTPFDRALTPNEINDWNNLDATELNIRWQEFLEANGDREVELTFWHSGDARDNQVYKARFFRASYHRMKDHVLDRYPELCEAVVTEACCAKGSNARKWVSENFDKTQYRCDGERVGFGTAHVFHSKGMAEPILERIAHGNFTDQPFEAWSWEKVSEMIPRLVPEEEGGGAAISREMGGYVRAELFFPLLQDILKNKHGVTFQFNTEPVEFKTEDVENGVEVTMQRRTQTWQLTEDDDGVPGIMTLVDATRSPFENSTYLFESVVVATGAAVGSALEKVDPNIGWRDLMPVFGYVVSGKRVLVHDRHERQIGVINDDYHQYIRSRKNGAVVMGGAMFVGPRNDAAVEALAYDASMADAYMGQSELGKQLLEDPELERVAGCRPMSKHAEFPLLKSDPTGRIIVHTGGGALGYSLYWKSAELAAQMVYRRGVLEEPWEDAWQGTEE